MDFRTRCQEAAPAHIPYRYFLTAPLFGVLSGALMLLYGPQAVALFWHPLMLANIHLLGLGLFTMALAGMLLQCAPILSGRPLLCSRWLAAVIHALLTLGTLGLAYGFFAAERRAMGVSLLLLIPALIWFVLVGLAALWRMRGDAPPALGMRLGLLSLLIATVLGVWAALPQLLDVQAAYHARLVQVHSGWAVFGWGLLFVFGFSLYVLPGFYSARPFRPGQSTMIPGVVLLSLFLGSVLVLLDEYNEWFVWIRPFAYLLVAAFAGLLLLAWSRLLGMRDPSLGFWHIALFSLLLAVLIWLARMQGYLFVDFMGFHLLLGVLLLPGFMLSVVMGLFYKLLPCLQGRAGCPQPREPEALLSRQRARRQLWVYGMSLGLFLASVFYPYMSHLAGGVFVAAQLMLFLNVLDIRKRALAPVRRAI